MHNQFTARVSRAAVIAIAIVVSASQVRAQQELELISGSSSITINETDGQATYFGSVGSWNVNSATGLAIPTEGPGTIDLLSVDLTSTGTPDSLTILWSGDGYTQTGDFSATLGGTLSSGISAQFTSYYGGLGSTVTPLPGLLSFNTPAFSGTRTGTATGPSPFALTEEVVVTGGTAASSQISFDFNVETVPEPSTIALLLIGGSALAVRRHKGKLPVV
jgi:hypothetical protein